MFASGDIITYREWSIHQANSPARGPGKNLGWGLGGWPEDLKIGIMGCGRKGSGEVGWEVGGTAWPEGLAQV